MPCCAMLDRASHHCPNTATPCAIHHELRTPAPCPLPPTATPHATHLRCCMVWHMVSTWPSVSQRQPLKLSASTGVARRSCLQAVPDGEDASQCLGAASQLGARLRKGATCTPTASWALILGSMPDRTMHPVTNTTHMHAWAVNQGMLSRRIPRSSVAGLTNHLHCILATSHDFATGPRNAAVLWCDTPAARTCSPR